MITVDVSNIWGEISLPDLLGIEGEVFAAHNTLMDGSGAGGGFRGWLKLPAQKPTEEVERLLDAAQVIRESCDVLVVLGSGDVCAGAGAVIELLQGQNCNVLGANGDPQIVFAGNSLSSRSWNELTKLLEGKDYALCVISRDGSEVETAAMFRNLRWLLERKYGTDEANQRIFTVTDGENGTLRQMTEAEGWVSFTMPEDVSGPFAVLSAAGLLPMAVAGIDIMEVLRGAWDAKTEFDLRSFENPVWLYTAVRNLMYKSGKSLEVLEFFEPCFAGMGRWWQRLFAGAEGNGPLPVAAELPGDMYALAYRNLLGTMIRFDPAEQKMVIGEDAKNLDDLNYLAGMDLDYVQDMARECALECHVDSGMPVVSIECSVLNERTAGELLWFVQLSCSISAYMLGINPFERTEAENYRGNLSRMLGKSGCVDV